MGECCSKTEHYLDRPVDISGWEKTERCIVSHGEAAANGTKSAIASAADWLDEPVPSRDIALVEETVTGLHISAIQAAGDVSNLAARLRTAGSAFFEQHADTTGTSIVPHNDTSEQACPESERPKQKVWLASRAVIGRSAENLPDVVWDNLSQWLNMDLADVAMDLKRYNAASIVHEVTDARAIRVVQDLFDKTLQDRRISALSSQPSVQLSVVRVVKVTNPAVAAEYKYECELLSDISADVQNIDVLTDHSVMPGFAEPLDASVNEKLLFHGAFADVADAILVTRARTIKPGRSSSGAFYGPGAYFSESVSKADQFARPDADGLFPIIVNRVALGRVKTIYDQPGAPEALPTQCSPGGFYDAVCGNRTMLSAAGSNHREFVVYSARRSMPCYLVWYRRMCRNGH